MRKFSKKIQGEICHYCDYSAVCHCPCKDAKEFHRKKFKAQGREELRKINKEYKEV